MLVAERVKETKSPDRDNREGNRVLSLCLLFAGIILLLHWSKVLPADRVFSLGKATVVASTIEQKEYLLTVPFHGDATRFVLMGDGQKVELKKNPANSKLTQNNYVIENGVLCWKQAAPPAKHYDLIATQPYKWSLYAAIVSFFLAALIAAPELRNMARSVVLFANKNIARLIGAVKRLRDACKPAFHSNSSSTLPASPKANWTVIASCTVVLALMIYLNTGTLSPLNLFSPLIVDVGISPVNMDHDFHRAVYFLVDGHGSEVVEPYKMLFRRVLYSWLAYPFMKQFGFILGGTIASFILNITSFVICCAYATTRWGRRAGIWAAILLCCYPGCAYYGGLPYCYGLIVPSSLLCAIGLSELERTNSVRTTSLLSLMLGVLCLGYDLLGFLLPAVTILLCLRKEFRKLVVSVLCLCSPLAVWCVFIFNLCGSGALVNSNTSVFANAVYSWLHLYKPDVFLQVVTSIPAGIGSVAHVFLFSTFGFLPTLFLISALSSIFMKDTKLSVAESVFIACSLALCFAAAISPTCESSGFARSALGEWQLKGNWAVRVYQPMFAMFILFLARKFSTLKHASPGWRLILYPALILCLCGNFLTGFGTFLNNPLGLSSTLYYEFNPAGEQDRLQWNLATYGRLPIGFFNQAKALDTQKNSDSAGASSIATIRRMVKPLGLEH